MGESDTYHIRPNHQQKFRPAVVKECIREIVRERLSGVQYNPEEVPELTRSLADSVKDKVKNSGFDKYKLVVQVVIGEQRGQGVKMSSRCFWDADTDSYAEDVFMNVSALLSHNFITRVRFLKSTLIVFPQDSLFCVVAVFGSYYY
uniref:Tctex1 domain containing 2 n=1 Tax=Pundamilia nyererei TaxID=303518 RepID=A0A3B4H384_9CICH